MFRARRTVVALVAAVLLALGGVTALGAEDTPVQLKIFGDYSLDHVINGSYSAGDLQAAIAEAKAQGAGYEEFQSAVEDVYDRDFLGLRTGSGNGQTAQQPEVPSTLLPAPRGPGERDRPPWPFLALTALGAALVVSGAGSSIYRRVHR